MRKLLDEKVEIALRYVDTNEWTVLLTVAWNKHWYKWIAIERKIIFTFIWICSEIWASSRNEIEIMVFHRMKWWYVIEYRDKEVKWTNITFAKELIIDFYRL